MGERRPAWKIGRRKAVGSKQWAVGRWRFFMRHEREGKRSMNQDSELGTRDSGFGKNSESRNPLIRRPSDYEQTLRIPYAEPRIPPPEFHVPSPESRVPNLSGSASGGRQSYSCFVSPCRRRRRIIHLKCRRPSPSSFRYPAIQTLPNGLQVVVVERHTLPLITLRLVVKSGAECDPPNLPGTAALVNGLLDRRHGPANLSPDRRSYRFRRGEWLTTMSIGIVPI